MSALLASVRSAHEAAIALDGGADIIDVKEPSEGALGAAPPEEIAAVVQRVGGRRPVSATVGDLPARPELVCPAVERTAAAGADIVKVGLFDNGGHAAVIDALSAQAGRGLRLVVVMFADRSPDFGLLSRLARGGLYGVMLDTADKERGSLRSQLGAGQIARFVAEARAQGLLVGLAGSLGVDDVAPLLALEPDFLGFRGALCAGGRSAALDAAAVSRVRTLIPRACQHYHGAPKHSLPGRLQGISPESA